MSDRIYEAANAFRQSKAGVALFYGYLVAILISGVLLFHVIQVNGDTARQSNRALCALKLEREKRVAQTSHILNSHDPESIALVEKFGRPLLERSLSSAQIDAAALSDVSC